MQAKIDISEPDEDNYQSKNLRLQVLKIYL